MASDIARRLLGLAALFLASSGAYGDDIKLQIQPDYSGGTEPQTLNVRSMYAVEVSCAHNGPLPRLSTKPGANWLPADEVSASHLILVTPSNPTGIFTQGATLPPQSMLTLVYNVDAKQTSFDNIDTGCTIGELIPNPQSDKLYAVVVAGYSKTTDAGILANAIDSVISLVASAAGVVGHPASAGTQAQITAAGNLATPINAIIGYLDPNTVDQRQKPLILGEEKRTITTAYSNVVINVRPVTAVTTDTSTIDPGNPHPYLNILQHDANITGAKIQSATAATDCTGLDAKLYHEGFRDPSDRAYGLMLAADGAIDHTLLTACLGPNLVSAPRIFDRAEWSDFDTFKPSDLSIQTTLGSKLKVRLSDLTALLRNYAGSKAPAVAKRLLTYIAKDVHTADETLIFQSDDFPNGFPEFADYLVKNGYYHYGYFVITDGDEQTRYHGARVGFLAIHATATATRASVDDAIEIFPSFTGDLITSLMIGKDHQEMCKAARANSGGNGFILDTSTCN